jgi:mRNA interferase MazF
MKKDFDIWNKKKTDLDLSERKILFNECEIWWCSIGLNIGVEIDGKNEDFERPVLIYKKVNNKSFLGVPLTSKIKLEKYNLLLKIKERETTLCLNQIKIFSSKRLLRKLSKISNKKIKIIDDYFIDIIKNRNPLSGESQVPIGNNINIINE